MSTTTSNMNKRGGAAVDDEQQQPDSASSPKRQRRSSVEDPANNDADSSSAAAAAADTAHQLIAELERQKKTSADRLALLKRQQDEERRRHERLAQQLAAAKKQLAQAERQAEGDQRRRRANINPRIQEALQTYKSGSVPLGELLNEQFPDLIDTIDFWWAFLDENLPTDVTAYETLKDSRPQSVLNSKKLVLQLCSYDPKVYVTIGRVCPLRKDTEILEVALGLHPFIVTFVPDEVLLQNPNNIVGKALARLPLWFQPTHDRTKRMMGTNAWRNRDVVLGWVKGGGELHDHIPENIREDPEILLAVMGKMKPANLQNPNIPLRLRGCINFMKKAVERNPLALSLVAENLKGNEDLAIAALSSPHGALVRKGENDTFIGDGEASVLRRRRRFWYQVGEKICQQLHFHHDFVELILGSVLFSESKPTTLAVLDQGNATAKAYLELVAEFAGVPIGKELGMLRRARSNLVSAGIICPSDFSRVALRSNNAGP